MQVRWQATVPEVRPPRDHAASEVAREEPDAGHMALRVQDCRLTRGEYGDAEEAHGESDSKKEPLGDRTPPLGIGPVQVPEEAKHTGCREKKESKTNSEDTPLEP